MTYLSPFRYLQVGAEAAIDPIVIQRAKKRLLAEFELGNAEVMGMSRHDALQWLDSLKPDELYYHRLIYDRPAILMFLEKGEASDERWYDSLPNDGGARNFIQALVQPRFNTLFTDAFQKNDIARLQALAKFDLPDVDRKGRYYFSGVMNILTRHYSQLMDASGDVAMNGALLQQLVAQPFFDLLPALPPYFNATRDGFAVALIQTAHGLTSSGIEDFYGASLLLKTALLVAASPETIQQARIRLNALAGKTKIGTSSHARRQSAYQPPQPVPPEQKQKSNLRSCLILLFIIFTIVRVLMMFFK